MPSLTIDTPTGPFTLTEDAGRIVRAQWAVGGRDHTPVLDRAAQQLAAYFAGTRTGFNLPLTVTGSDLQRRVCAVLARIPHGRTRTYGDIAKEIGVPAQAVGQACGGNPIPVIIPCHRVLGGGGLGGFSGGGGVETKVVLLKLEGAASLLI